LGSLDFDFNFYLQIDDSRAQFNHRIISFERLNLVIGWLDFKPNVKGKISKTTEDSYTDEVNGEVKFGYN
jgi:hypothetical protein